MVRLLGVPSQNSSAARAVGENLQRVLSATKEHGGMGSDYGTGDWTAFEASAPAVDALANEVFQTVRRYEPRLAEPVVEVAGVDGAYLVLAVSGLVGGEPAHYTMALHRSHRSVCVELEEGPP